ncbi:MAG: hypothetical protein R3D55_22180 [Chloroflexota bacterium]
MFRWGTAVSHLTFAAPPQSIQAKQVARRDACHSNSRRPRHSRGAARTPPEFLRPGDVLTSIVEGVGGLRNVVTAV